VARVDGRVPLPGQRRQQRRLVVAGHLERQVHILERPLQRELGREIAAFHLVQLGVRDRRVQRSALDGLVQPGGVDAQPASQLQGLGDALDQRGHVGVDDELQLAALAGLAQPHGFAADRRERRPDDRLRRGRPRRQDQ
jgi:hypothetical protein